MIIGISGKSQSGKDTVGSIIQYLTSNETGSYEASQQAQKKYGNLYPEYSSWQIKKFADKLKDMICIVLNCTREQLEDNNFKSTELGEEWIRYGKADGFFYGGSMSNPIMNNKSCTKEEYEAELKINWQTAYITYLTPRSILQLLGTEVGRFIHRNFWINTLFVEYKPKVCSGEVHCALKGKPEISCNLCPEYPNWIITDVRFPNEAEAIKERGGLLIRVNRKDARSRFAAIDKPKEKSKYYHPSETSLDDYEGFDVTIDNDYSMDDLVRCIKTILKSKSII